MMACPDFLTRLSLDKNSVSRTAKCTGTTLTLLSQLWASKISFRSTKRVFPYVRNAQSNINLVRLNKIGLQETSIRHQVNTFQMCPNGISSCNGALLVKQNALVVQMHTNIAYALPPPPAQGTSNKQGCINVFGTINLASGGKMIHLASGGQFEPPLDKHLEEI